jgi:molecular chaperone DnaK
MTDNAPTKSKPSQPPIGIDLGTTYSVVAYLDASGRPTTVVNGSGDLLTPSAVLFDDGEVVVGKEAIKGSLISPDAFADCFKRDIGRTSFRRALLGQQIPPEVLDGFLLRRLKEDTERRLGPIRQVVITVPAFFDETRRKATQDAGRLAGLEVLDIINEPTAAAVAFGYHRTMLHGSRSEASSRPERVLVYDLGGGTFDVTILEICGNTFRALATDGDVQLGGKDFDERLVNHLAERFLAEHGADPRSVPGDAMQLWIDAQEAKHALTERNKTTVVCVHAGVRMRVDVTRAEFEALTRDLLERTETTTDLVLKQTGHWWSEIDRVLLVGGSTRMPMVVDMLRRISGKEPDRSQSPDEVVAHGAALYAGLLMGGAVASSARGFNLINVNSHSLGVVGTDPKTQERVTAVLIPKNTALPCRSVKRFRTAKSSQRNVRVDVVEGESRRPEHCIALGQCIVRDLPPDLPKGTQVDVEFAYAANGRISVVARVPSVRQSSHVELQRQAVRKLEDLETWRNRLGEAPSSGIAPARQPRPLDPESLQKKLDDAYVEAGRHAMKMELSLNLGKLKQAAVAATRELERATAAMKKAEAEHQTAVGPQEAVRSATELAQARQAAQRAQTHCRFAQLVLGRECLAAGHVPPEFQGRMAEVQRWQEQKKKG